MGEAIQFTVLHHKNTIFNGSTIRIEYKTSNGFAITITITVCSMYTICSARDYILDYSKRYGKTYVHSSFSFEMDMQREKILRFSVVFFENIVRI